MSCTVVAVQEVGCAPVPTVSPDQSGFFGVQFRTQPTAVSPYEGRVEHVVSGQVTRFDSLEELLAFMIRVLRHVQQASGP